MIQRIKTVFPLAQYASRGVDFMKNILTPGRIGDKTQSAGPDRDALTRRRIFIVFAVAFIVSLRWQFPYDSLAGIAERETRNATQGQLTLALGNGGAWGLTGVKFTDAQAVFRFPGGKVTLPAKSLGAKGLFRSLLLARPVVRAGADTLGGEIEATFYAPGIFTNNPKTAIEIEGIDLAGVQLDIAGFGETLVAGKAKGEAVIEFSEVPESGKISAEVEGLNLGVPLKNWLKEPLKLTSGKLEFSAGIENGRMAITRGTLHSDQLDLELEGTLDMKSGNGDGALDIGIRLKPGPKFDKKLELLLMTMKKHEDGSYTMRIKGTPANPLPVI